jgi:Fic family protein
MKPPFKITNKILMLVSKISAIQGRIESTGLVIPEPQLRKKNKIKTIQGTLSIEGNTFTEEQITALLDGKKVLGNQLEIQEVINTNKLYESLDKYKHWSVPDLLKSHKVLMAGLIDESGMFRSKNVGVLKGSKVAHLAPKPNMVPELVGNLFKWIKTDKEVHPLISSSVVHYELEFIHPFQDGNGRTGRFWQSLVLVNYDPIFRFIPIESLVKVNQEKYYKSLGDSDKLGDSTPFIEFMLTMILESFEIFSSQIVSVTISNIDRIDSAAMHFGKLEFSRKDYMILHKDISSATASRDLKTALTNGTVKQVGEGNQTKYLFIS